MLYLRCGSVITCVSAYIPSDCSSAQQFGKHHNICRFSSFANIAQQMSNMKDNYTTHTHTFTHILLKCYTKHEFAFFA